MLPFLKEREKKGQQRVPHIILFLNNLRLCIAQNDSDVEDIKFVFSSRNLFGSKI